MPDPARVANVADSWGVSVPPLHAAISCAVGNWRVRRIAEIEVSACSVVGLVAALLFAVLATPSRASQPAPVESDAMMVLERF